MGQIAFVFAGQGAQFPGMGQELYETSAAARAVFDLCESLRPGTLSQCFHGPKEVLDRTVHTQPCLFAMDLACARAAQQAGLSPAACAGFSLGEVAAAAFCGILTDAEAFRLVCSRGQWMDDCAQAHPGGMAAVLRLTAQQVEQVCQGIDGAYPVNYNAPGQTVVAGTQQALAQLREAVAAQRGRALPLSVSGAFHSPYMREASERLHAQLQALPLRAASLPLYANATAQPYPDAPEEIAALLARQVQSPVRWQQSVERMAQDGIDTFVEVGAGKTLSGLVKKIVPAATVCRVEDARTLADALAQMQGGAACKC